MNSMRIGIITLYDDINYGNKLQNYATQSYFEKYGYEVETIPYYTSWNSVRNYTYRLKRICHRVLRYLKFENGVTVNNKILNKRRKCIRNFSKTYLKLHKKVTFISNLNYLNKEFDFFVTGSDQVWHLWYGEKAELDFFFLRFADKNKRLTMSPSFGFKEIPEKYEYIYKYGIEGFNRISCRENNGAEIIKKLTNKDAEVLIDPTMLLSANEWTRLAKKPELFEEDNYILLYSLGGVSPKVRDVISRFEKTTNHKIIDLEDINNERYTNTRPDEFLYWIMKAQYVITDSFHATVFSIIFRKKFFTFQRNDTDGMENRIHTLLSLFGLESRQLSLLSKDEDWIIKDLSYDISFQNIDEVLERERKRVRLFYSEQIKMIEKDK